ncbi:MAG: hypothetical protein SVK08_01160 [Halobacteriota archaeon]|nr:hypothetical protein [Halobacteriota archaeon]
MKFEISFEFDDVTITTTHIFNQSEGVAVETKIKHCHFTGEDSVEENKIFFESEDTKSLDISIYS